MSSGLATKFPITGPALQFITDFDSALFISLQLTWRMRRKDWSAVTLPVRAGNRPQWPNHPHVPLPRSTKGCKFSNMTDWESWDANKYGITKRALLGSKNCSCIGIKSGSRSQRSLHGLLMEKKGHTTQQEISESCAFSSFFTSLFKRSQHPSRTTDGLVIISMC